MVNRQDYMRQNKRDDTRLTQLYDQENTQLNSIQSWRVDSAANRDGVLSFYIDGYENDLTAASLDALTPADIRAVLAGSDLATTADTRSTGIYRIVNQDTWYVALVSSADDWIPVVGQNYYLQFEGFADLEYSATVTNVQKSSGTVLAIFEINQPIGPMIYQLSLIHIFHGNLRQVIHHPVNIHSRGGRSNPAAPCALRLRLAAVPRASGHRWRAAWPRTAIAPNHPIAQRGG